jgi:ribosomal-protein-alanine acetyltransferase
VSAENPPRIELATQEDATEIRALVAHLESPFDVDTELRRAHARLWVARRADTGARVLGLLLAWEVADSADLIDLIVEPTERRRGLGRALLQALLDHARSRNLRSIVLEVRASNAGARKLYEALGFRDVGERRAYYADGENARLYAYEFTA